MKTSEYEERIGITNKFVKSNSPSQMFDTTHDIKETYSKSEDFIKGTIDELTEYFTSHYNPAQKPSKYNECKPNEKYLMVPVNKEYFQKILDSPTPTGFVFYILCKSPEAIEVKSQPVFVLPSK